MNDTATKCCRHDSLLTHSMDRSDTDGKMVAIINNNCIGTDKYAIQNNSYLPII